MLLKGKIKNRQHRVALFCTTGELAGSLPSREQYATTMTLESILLFAKNAVVSYVCHMQRRRKGVGVNVEGHASTSLLGVLSGFRVNAALIVAVRRLPSHNT